MRKAIIWRIQGEPEQSWEAVRGIKATFCCFSLVVSSDGAIGSDYGLLTSPSDRNAGSRYARRDKRRKVRCAARVSSGQKR